MLVSGSFIQVLVEIRACVDQRVLVYDGTRSTPSASFETTASEQILIKCTGDEKVTVLFDSFEAERAK